MITKEQKLMVLDLLYRDRPLSIEFHTERPDTVFVGLRKALQAIRQDIEDAERIRKNTERAIELDIVGHNPEYAAGPWNYDMSQAPGLSWGWIDTGDTILVLRDEHYRAIAWAEIKIPEGK